MESTLSLQLLMCVFELPISHILPGRTCRKSTKIEGKEGQTKEPLVDRMQIGSFHLSRSVYTPVCVGVSTLSGWDSIRQESAKKYEALILLQKLVNQKRATVLGRPIDLT